MFLRNNTLIKKIVPIRTWSPWKPVNIKKLEPKVESLILKKADEYSFSWRTVKKVPKIEVKNKKTIDFLILFLKK